MKILMVAPGGSVHSLKPLKLLLNEKNIKVIFMDEIDPFPDGKANYKFVPIRLLRKKRTLSKIFGYKLLYFIEDLYLSIYFKKVINKYSPDIIHVHWIDERILYLRKAGAKPIIASAWGTDINQHFALEADTHLKELKGKCLNAADLIIVDSKIVDKRCSLLAGNPLRFETLHLGIDTDIFKQGYQKEVIKLKEQLKINDDYKIILSARGWQSYYNQEFILQAFSMILEEFPKTILLFKLHNCSKVQSLVNMIKTRVDKLNIKNNIRWIDDVPLESLPVVYNMCDLIVNYPSMDTLPVTFMEAAACCRQVVSCKLPTYEGTFAEKYFTLVEGSDIYKLVDALKNNLGDSSSIRSDVLKEARAFIINNYDQKFYLNKLLNIYNEMIKEIKVSA